MSRMEMADVGRGNVMEQKRKFQGNNIFWIIFLVVALYVVLCGLPVELISKLAKKAGEWAPGVTFINENYTGTIGAVLVLFAYCLIVKKNRFILRSFLPAGKGRNHEIKVIEDTYEPTQNNTAKTLILGLLLGFVTNFFCIACALAHGDIKLVCDFSASQIPVMLYGLVMVFIQSSSEEMWCRGFMYERINIHYPLWVAVVVNGIFFGLLHAFNDGVTVLAVISIIVCGMSYSLVRWYSGSIWLVMGIHTMWNFTQNFLFGLPNSGLVSEVSVFRLDAVKGTSNLIYNYGFGVESAIPAILADCTLGIVVLLLAKKNGRLGELFMSHEKRAAIAEAAEAAEAAETARTGAAEEKMTEAATEAAETAATAAETERTTEVITEEEDRS